MNHQKSQRWTTDSFVAQAKQIHGDKYDYSNVTYSNSKTKLTIGCKSCGHVWKTLPFNHLAGRGCKKCQYKCLPQNQSWTHEQFLERAIETHGDRYEYLSQYRSIKEKIVIKCCACSSVFKQKVSSHLDGCGCKKCADRISKESQLLNYDVFVDRCNSVHNNRYSYERDYCGWNEKVTVICPEHGKFRQEAGAHMRGQGCPVCDASKGEIAVERWLLKNGFKFVREKRFTDCRGCRYPLPFDFYLEDQKVCIEYDGYQHYYPVKVFGGMAYLIKTQTNDQIKNEYCKANNIKLVRVPFFEKVEDFLNARKNSEWRAERG